MKKIFLFLVLVFPLSVAVADNVWVAVKKSTIKAKPTFLSPTIATVNYQEELSLSKKNNAWWNVSNGDAHGWMHQSALSDEKLEAGKKKGPSTMLKTMRFFGRLSSDEDDSGKITSLVRSANFDGNESDEVTLAGKGFNKEVEGIYRQKEETFNYAAVDLMESEEIEIDAIKQFVTEGLLTAKQLPSEIAEKSSSNENNSFGDF